jgi:hypothetical protein
MVIFPVPYADGFEADNFINVLGQSILFHNYDFDHLFFYVLEIGK